MTLNNHDDNYKEDIINTITSSLVPPGAEIGDLIVEENIAGYRTDGVYIVDHDFKNKRVRFLNPMIMVLFPKNFNLEILLISEQIN